MGGMGLSRGIRHAGGVAVIVERGFKHECVKSGESGT